jgi:two-component system chemotaxis response regulator CheB
MPPIFTSVFADHLRAATGRTAREPLQGERLLHGAIYVAPGGRHLRLARGMGRPVAQLDDGPPVNFCKPAVDHLFIDAARHFAGQAVAVVLTGMGHDGLGGARALKEAGAPVLVQDEATSAVWGMPGSIARAGLADAVLDIEGLSVQVARLIAGCRT